MREEEPDVHEVCQPPLEVFPWPKGWRITAVDEAIIAVPELIMSDGEEIGSVIHGDDDVRIGVPGESSPQKGHILLWLRAGESVWLSKSCEALVVPEFRGDTRARRFLLSRVSSAETDQAIRPN